MKLYFFEVTFRDDNGKRWFVCRERNEEAAYQQALCLWKLKDCDEVRRKVHVKPQGRQRG